MIDTLTPGDRERLADLVKLVVGAAAPEIIKCVAVSRGGVRVEAIGDVLSVEPATVDHRKGLWCAVFTNTLETFPNDIDRAMNTADGVVELFDLRFPA